MLKYTAFTSLVLLALAGLSGCFSTTTAPRVAAVYDWGFVVAGGIDVPFTEFENAAHRWCAHQGKRAEFANLHGGDAYDHRYGYICVEK